MTKLLWEVSCLFSASEWTSPSMGGAVVVDVRPGAILYCFMWVRLLL